MDRKISRLLALKKTHPKHRSAQHFDLEYFESLDLNARSRLLECLNSGIENPDSEMGCYALFPEDYDDFMPFFSQVITDYHGIEMPSRQLNDWNIPQLDELSGRHLLDLGVAGISPLSMRVRTARNLRSHPLPGGMTRSQRLSLENLMLPVFQALSEHDGFGGEYYSLTPGHANLVSQNRYRSLVQSHYMFRDMSKDPFLTASGIANDWPYGRGCYLSDDRGFMVWVGEEDHLRVMCLETGTVLNTVYDRLRVALELIESNEGLEFSRSEKLGVITSCPTNLGTAMRASLHMSLPALVNHERSEHLSTLLASLGLAVRGVDGEHTASGSDGTIDISPRQRFGVSEAQVLVTLYKGAERLKAEEDRLNS